MKRLSCNRIAAICVLWCGIEFTATSAIAANIYWDGTGTSWNLTSPWSTSSFATTPNPAAPPGDNDTAIFSVLTVNTSQVVNLNADQSILGLVFNRSNTVRIQTGSGANTLTIRTGGITLNSNAGGVNIISAVSLRGSQTWTNDSSDVLTVGGNISNGINQLTISGTGSTTISGNI